MYFTKGDAPAPVTPTRFDAGGDGHGPRNGCSHVQNPPVPARRQDPEKPAEGMHALAISRPPPRPRRAGMGRWIVALCLLLVVGAVGILRYGAAYPAEHMRVQAGRFEAELSGPGTLDALRKASISSRVQGVLASVRVDRGDQVRAGEVIAKIAAPDLKAQLDVALASREAARTAIDVAFADRDRAQAALANAQSTFARQQQLLRTEMVSKSGYESAQAAHLQAQADLTHADAAISQAQAQERSAAASVEVSRAQLEDSIIRAPIDGIVVSRALNPGDLVSPGSKIVEIVDPASVLLTARYDESAMALVAPGQGAMVRFSSQGAAVAGQVHRIGREVDSETREFTVDVVPDRLPVNWAMGQRGIAIIHVDLRDDVVAIPVRAVAWRQGRAGVWTIERGRAAWRPVELGAIGGARVEVRSGLEAGEAIILAPDGIYAGMRVSRVDAPS